MTERVFSVFFLRLTRPKYTQTHISVLCYAFVILLFCFFFVFTFSFDSIHTATDWARNTNNSYPSHSTAFTQIPFTSLSYIYLRTTALAHHSLYRAIFSLLPFSNATQWVHCIYTGNTNSIVLGLAQCFSYCMSTNRPNAFLAYQLKEIKRDVFESAQYISYLFVFAAA